MRVSSTAFTGVFLTSTLILALLDGLRNKVPLAPRFSEKRGSATHHKVSGTFWTKRKEFHTRSQETQSSQTHKRKDPPNQKQEHTIPTLPKRSNFGAFFLRDETRRETKTHPFASISTLVFHLSRLASSSLSFLSLLSLLPLCLLFAPLSQLLKKLSSYIALYSLIKSPSPLGNAPLSSQHSLCGDVPTPFLLHEFLQLQIPPFGLLHSFLVTLIPAAFHRFAFLSGTASSFNKIYNIFPYSFVSWLSGLQRFISLGPRRHRA